MQSSTAQKTEGKTKKVKAEKKPSAAHRTVSLFTGRTDLEGADARDGHLPQAKPRKPRLPNRRWVSSSHSRDAWTLEEGSGARVRPVARITHEADGTWAAFTYWNSKRTTGLPTKHHAANAAEGML